MGRWLDDTEANTGHVFSVMACYRAWSHWCAKLDGGGYQVRHVAARKDRLTHEQLLDPLCEIYARAVFECALSMNFDRVDSHVDHEVLLQILEAFGLQTADDVYRAVEKVGPVVLRGSEGDAMRRLGAAVGEVP